MRLTRYGLDITKKPLETKYLVLLLLSSNSNRQKQQHVFYTINLYLFSR